MASTPHPGDKNGERDSFLHAKKKSSEKSKQAVTYADNSLICRDKCQAEEENEGLANELFTCLAEGFKCQVKYKHGSKM